MWVGGKNCSEEWDLKKFNKADDFFVRLEIQNVDLTCGKWRFVPSITSPVFAMAFHVALSHAVRHFRSLSLSVSRRCIIQCHCNQNSRQKTDNDLYQKRIYVHSFTMFFFFLVFTFYNNFGFFWGESCKLSLKYDDNYNYI